MLGNGFKRWYAHSLSVKLKFRHIMGSVYFRDIFAIAVLVSITILLYVGKITATVFAAVLGVVLGYYFGRGSATVATAS